jgi:hypothetical protein
MNPTLSAPRSRLLRLVFVGLVSLSAIVELVIGVAMIVDFPRVLETGFGATYTPDLAAIGLALGCNLLFLATALALSAIWTLAHKREGLILGIAASMVFVAFGVLAFVQLGQVDALLIDALRGVLTVAAGVVLLLRERPSEAL